MGKWITPWIGVDLDGTLAMDVPGASYDPLVIGPPVPEMVARVRAVLDEGEFDVRIFTARAAADGELKERIEDKIKRWCKEHLGRELPITCQKDYGLREIWDDRAWHVVRNTGKMPEKEGV